jgi:biotin carboxyl carrier protein
MSKSQKPKLKLADIKYDNSPDYVTFVVHTAKYRTLPTKKYLNRKKWIENDPKQIFSGIPGSIHRIFIKNGDNVKKNDLLLELDAMKMYNKILAPMDGIVKIIHVEEKQKVGKNVLLIELE